VNPQTLLFSATLPAWVRATANKYMKDGVETVDLVGQQGNQTATNVTVSNTNYAYKVRYRVKQGLEFCYFATSSDRLPGIDILWDYFSIS